jgi:hypothetical protein
MEAKERLLHLLGRLDEAGEGLLDRLAWAWLGGGDVPVEKANIEVECPPFAEGVEGKREDDRLPPPFQVMDDSPDVPPRLGIEAGRRFVEEDEFRIAHQGDGDPEALLLPAGEGPHEGVCLVGKLHPSEDLRDGESALEEGGEQGDDLLHLEVGLEVPLLEENADPCLRRAVDAAELFSEDLDCPRVRLADPLQDLQGRRLPGPVWAEQGEGWSPAG